MPGTSLNNGQLDDAGVFTTGNAAGWLGYVGRIGRPGGAAGHIFTRPAQVGGTEPRRKTDNSNNAGGGAFDNPTGTVIQGGGGGALFTNGNIYTMKLRVTYDAGTGLATVNYVLSDGGGTIDSLGADNGRHDAGHQLRRARLRLPRHGHAGPFSLNLSSLKVETNVLPIPEPTSLVLACIAGLAWFSVRRRG